jgi:arabinofuranosyltransferase
MFLLSLIGGLGMLNRLDTSLLFMPVILQSGFAMPRLRALVAVALGFLPFLIWEIFSLIYYGFLIPNTAYAKLEVGISRIELIKQGTYYFWNSLCWDPLTLVAIATSITVCLAMKNKRQRYAALGVAFYLLYVLLIGGDFMSGRYFSAPLFVAVIILATSNIELTIKQTLAAFSAIILLGTISLHPPILSGAGYGTGEPGRLAGVSVGTFDDHGIADERAYYYKYSGLLNARAGFEMPTSPLVEKGRLQRLKHKPAVSWSNIGFFGFFAGPEVYIIDRYGISNPLLARLPINTNSTNSLTNTHWRIGHFPRKFPDGYVESLSTGENRIVDVKTSELYDTLELITRGDIFDQERLKAIWKINSRWLGW